VSTKPTPDPRLFVEGLEPRVLLSTLTVTTSNDSGTGSLRQAIIDANDAPGADIIEFDPSLAGSTIALTSGQFNITDALEIRGTDSEGTPLGITISADNDSRHFYIFDSDPENDIEVTISDLTITKGRLVNEYGGSILNLEDLTLERVTMSSNSSDSGLLTGGGAIHSTGPLTIRDSEFVSNSSSGTGGAILFVGPSLIIADSTFTNNRSAVRGGAIYLDAGSDATISGTTFASNLATGDGGAIHLVTSTLTVSDSTLSENRVGRHGGAIGAESGSTVTINDSTIENGSAGNDGGAIYTDDGTITIEGSTLSGNNAANGGGVYNFAGTLSLTDSTVAGNVASASGGGLYADFDADLILLRVTVSGNASGGAAGGIYTSGGLTMTEGTVTNNAADSSGGGIRAIGPNPVSIVSSTISDNTSDSYGGGLVLHGTMNIEIAGSTFDNNTADEFGGGVSIRNNDGAEFSITGSTFNGNFADTSGGGLDVTSNVVLTITDSFFTDNFVGDPGPGIGGGIQFTQGTLTITNSTISGNESWGDGGGIYATSNLNISGSDITDNIATDDAGGIMFRGQTLSIADSTIRGNTAEETGGGLAARGSVEHQIIRTTIESNTASYGAGIGLTSEGIGNVPFRLDYSTVSSNTATARGGGIYYDFGALLISNSTISGNTAGDTGGGISQHRTSGQSTVANSTIAFNTVTNEDGQGGGIFIGGNGLTLTSTIVASNTHDFGDGTPDDITAESEDFTVDADSSFNLIGDANAGGGLTDGQNNNIVGADPLLEPLADNGGPTLTHAIPQNSPAVDAGAAFSALETDQRGSPFDRFVGDDPDIGAFEWAPFFLQALDGSATSSTSLEDGTLLSVTRNTRGKLIVFTGSGTEWTALRFADYTNAPDPTADPVIWTDPNDGLAYIAAPSDGGFLLFRRASNGTWSYRDLAAETASTDDAPVGTLAYFITRPNSGTPLVTITGINNAGEIVAYEQTSASGAAQASWSLYNISDDLASQSMTTPAFTKIVTYVTSWNQWTLAGLDADGNVQGVWVNVATFTTWRVDNLSTITGADPLAGELDVTLTPWGGIRFAGADDDGNLVATWWNPGRGPGNWSQTDLTAQVTEAAPTLVPGRLTAWFISGSNMISYAGYDADGDIVSLYWEPSDGGAWNADNLTAELTNRDSRPSGSITTHVTSTGEASLFGASDAADVVRLWSEPGSREFMLDILSDIATRV